MLGRSIKLYYNGALVAAAREKSITHSASLVDISDGYTDGYTRSLAQPGGISKSISISGLYVDDTFRNAIRSGSLLRNVTLVYPDRIIAGDFLITSYSEGMPYNDAMTFSASLAWSAALVIESYMTSRIYPVEAIEGAEHTSGDIHEAPAIAWIEGLDASGGVLEGVFRNPLITYTYWPAEDLESTGGGVLEGVFRNPLITYTYWPAEDLESTGGGTLDGVFRAALVTYTYWPAEDLESTGGGVLEGSHETA